MATNRLAGETSPYLLQHAHNPVDWYPWGREALARARAADRPIFLSIGYAACHWCHVMERESFEDAATAAQLNAAFVPIKVDREERPDLDAIYMAAVQAMTGRGGWPMSVFLTPQGRPFYGGTYFPATRGHGIPAFRDVLSAVEAAWRDRRDEVEAMARRLSDAIDRSTNPVHPDGHPDGLPAAAGLDRPAGAGLDLAAAAGLDLTAAARSVIDPDVLRLATQSLAASFDRLHGGWGDAPKFPQPAVIEFLLARAHVAGDGEALSIAVHALDAMAAGGIHDQVGGGFHRYSTDARWLVPHFEKMLYDNAQLARVYVHAYQQTGDERHAEVARRTLDYVRRELATPEGLFAASQDADTGGVEGATYTWSSAEFEDVLGADAPLAASAFGVTAAGNWEGRTILSRVRDDTALAAMYGVSRADVAARLRRACDRLLAVRGERPQPARDDKALAAWNGMAIAAFADAAGALGRDEDRDTAVTCAEGLLRLLRGPDGRLRRSYRAGRAELPGYLEDHAAVADGLLALYAATFDERWFVAARGLLDLVLERFGAPDGRLWDTADDHETLIARPRQVEDGATPSGGATSVAVLLRLAALTGNGRYRTAALRQLEPVLAPAARYPTAFGAWLQAIDLACASIDEIAIVGATDDPGTRTLVRVATRGFHPHRVVAVAPDPSRSAIELLQSRFALRGSPTAFVCRDFSCRQPVTEPEALAAQLVE
jgi:uncharacterized protein YyaL (SSP411 family)